ncbi:MAG: Ada metal-binding domain-containing protein [Pyrinomonadaceae bacterium]
MMSSPSANFWPSARQFAEAVQCPAVCFNDATLKSTLPAVDKLGMPLVTSGQFAYVFKLNPQGGGESLAVRCFRGFLGDREARYRALDTHFAAHRLAALPRFRYFPKGIFVSGGRYPVLVMEWITGPTLDVYLEEVVGRREVVAHLAEEWLRLMIDLRRADVAHGDLQHGNVIVEHGRLRLVDLDGMYVPALAGQYSSEVGHQHYQHPARGADFFSPAVDNFSALVIYLSLVALAERPALWAEHHDENLIFKRSDFAAPDASALFRQVREIGPEHTRLADALARACVSDPSESPWLLDLVQPRSHLPSWMTAPAGVEVGVRTREVARELEPAQPVRAPAGRDWAAGRQRRVPNSVSTGKTVQTIFGAKSATKQGHAPALDPSDIRGNTLEYARRMAGKSYAFIWWLPLHNFLMSNVWSSLGVPEGMGFLFTLVLFVAAFLFCGLVRAFYESEVAVPPARVLSALPQSRTTAMTTPPHAGLFGGPQPQLSAGGHATPTASAPATAVAAPQVASVAAPQIVGSRTLGIYHLPTCAWADRIAARSRIEFDAPASARHAGYRPCHVCQP